MEELLHGIVHSPPTETNVPANLSNVVGVAAGGGYHSLAMKNNGQLVAWGWNLQGQTNIPLGLTNVLSFAAGNFHNLALLGDGHVVAWGGNPFSPTETTNVPFGLSNVIAISAGEHSMALKRDGTVVAWGNNSNGETNVPTDLTNVVAIAAGDNNSVALINDGTIKVWGNNSYGQINVPAGLSNVVSVSAGNGHILALKANGEMVIWGNPRAYTNTPALSGVISMVAGSDHNLALYDNDYPQSLSNTVETTKNIKLSLTLGATDPNKDALVVRITGLPSLGTLFQYTNGLVGNPIQTPNTIVTDSSHRVFFLPVTNTFGSPYTSFQFVANDGTLDSAPATITVNVAGPPLATTVTPAPITENTATLNGLASANLRSTDVWFQWGTTTNYGNQTSTNNIGIGSNLVPVQNQIQGLAPLSTYHCQMVASNSIGLTTGADITFVTIPPILVSNLTLNESNRWQLDFDGFSNATYTVWASTNLTDWLPAGSATQIIPGKFSFDEKGTNFTQRFYQLRWP